MSNQTKKCLHCKEDKNVADFSKNKRQQDGYEIYCKKCRVEKRKQAKIRNQHIKNEITEKMCNMCDITKSIDHFSLDSAVKDGYRGHCKSCRSDYREEKAIEYSIQHQTQPTELKEKICTQCDILQPIDNFCYKKYIKSGFNSTCKTCDIQRQLETDRLKKLIVQRYLQLHNCIDCGCTDWKLLENDHINNDKLCTSSGKSYRTITKLPSCEKVAQELYKCEVVCVACHRKRTHSRFNEPSTHDLKVKKSEKQLFVNKEKLKIGKCMSCNMVIDSNLTYLFDWDHIDPETKISSISNLCGDINSTTEVISNEIKKCRLLCCHCHRLQTRKDGGWIDVEDATEEELKYVDELLKIYEPIKEPPLKKAKVA